MQREPQVVEAKQQGGSKYRYRILAMLFVATTINYMDRSIIGVLGPTLIEHVFHWTKMEYAQINMVFKFAYALGMLGMGGVIDRFGTRIGYILAIGIWSVFGMLHALVQPAFGFIGFCMARAGLGFGEAGNFPAAVKTVAEWYPKKDRAFATGIFNAGSNIGAILAPLAIPLVVLPDGTNWQFAFLMTGAFSFIWVLVWIKIYKKPEEHPKVSQEELAYIQSDVEEGEIEQEKEKMSWAKVLPLKQTWAFAIGKITDAVWWFYLFWGSLFLHDQFGLDLHGLALPMIIVFLIADVGSIAGGYLPKIFLNRGASLNVARKLTLLICALFILPAMFVPYMSNQWYAVLLMAFAAGGHQAWSANLFTVASDTMPKKATASVVGIGGMIGALAGMLADFSLGSVLTASGKEGYVFAFAIAGSIYLVCLALIHLIIPKLERAKI
ncbi:hexuronate transporter [Persicobacter diffluens]|uniref:Hexuronate transporter n=2 Tax=Persicobacter diffluens TaxID=981 RepID=A0AAN4W3X1_9BACT|nr:hexuronate transporter [Persicobacter diffluens]